MTTCTAVGIAFKNPAFKAACEKARDAVESGESTNEKVSFILDGIQYAYGYRCRYDEEMQGYDVFPVYYAGCRIRPGHYFGPKKPFIIR